MPTTAGQSEAALGLARALINTSQLPLLLFNGDLRVVGASRSFCSAFDIGHDQTDGRSLGELGKGEWDIPQLRVLLDNAVLDGPEMGDYETDLARLGLAPRRLVVNVRNVLFGSKAEARISLTIDDVTNERHAERQKIELLLEKDNLLRERAILLQEMQHRVANSLQIIASVLLIKARAVESEETRLHLQDAHDRVMSVAAVQHHLEFSLGDVEIGPYLTKLCDSLSSSMIRDSRPITLKVISDTATVTSQKAVSLGLIVTELVINALKHAFPDGRTGLVTVSYRSEPTQWSMTVTDNGVGRHPSPTAKVGLGTSVVEALARQLDAEVVISDAAPGAKISIVSVEASRAPANGN